MRYLVCLFLLPIVVSTNCLAQSPQTLEVRKFISSKQSDLMREYMAFLAIPNVASDTVNIRRNAAFIMEMMKKRGIMNVQLLDANSPTTPPAVFGEIKTPGATQTIIFYAHYDGQPVNPSQWAKGLSPFVPSVYSSTIDKGKPVETTASVEGDWRIYARGASDDKAGVYAIINGYEAVARNKMKVNYNIKFFFEGEGEAGSPHLAEILTKHRSLLQSDLWVICDGPVHQTGKKVISFGVRGDAHVNLTVYGPKRPLHSGHYGNWAPNPGMMLARLLTSMKDENGRVTIDGFYDDVTPLTAADKEALRNLPVVDDQMKRELGLGWTENKGMLLAETITLPSLNINGMQSGNVGKMASNQIPTEANAVLDLRLVAGNDWRRQQQKVMDHIRKQGFTIIDHDPTDEERMQHEKLIKVIAGDDGYNAQRTPMSLPIAQKVIDAVKSTTSDQVILVPTSGGSLPLYVFEKHLGASTITVPIANHDNNQHAENENIRIQNLLDGIESMAAVMTMK